MSDDAKATAIHVVICTYNRAHILIHTLEALATQDAEHDGSWKVLVVDNNCSDNTVELVAQYTDKLPRLEIVPEARQGLTEARQRGFIATDAPWVAFVDDDCVLARDWVRHALDFIRRHPDAAAFNGRNTLTFEDGLPRPWVSPAMFAGVNHDSDTETVVGGPLHGAGLTLRRAAVERSGWLDNPRAEDRRGNSLVSGGDNELSIRAKAGGGRLWYVPQCQLTHDVQVDRLDMRYLMRLNFRLAEAGPLLFLLQNRRSVKVWRNHMTRLVAGNFLRVVGIKTDKMRGSGSGVRGYVLSACRAVGTLAGTLKLLRKGHEEIEDIRGIATEEGVRAIRNASSP